MSQTSCGVLITDGQSLLLGHAARSPRWDIFKGLADPSERFEAAAARELYEETGLGVEPACLVSLGVHAYLPRKDLALFAWTVADLPDPSALVCRSMVIRPGAAPFPELDRFAAFPWDEALTRVGNNLRRVLSSLDRASLAA